MYPGSVTYYLEVEYEGQTDKVVISDQLYDKVMERFNKFQKDKKVTFAQIIKVHTTTTRNPIACYRRDR